jgi:hypothetical protein
VASEWVLRGARLLVFITGRNPQEVDRCEINHGKKRAGLASISPILLPPPPPLDHDHFSAKCNTEA